MSVKIGALIIVLLMTQAFASRLSSHDREHLQSHTYGQLDLSVMSEEELRFLYFQSHDSDANNKLDGCELVQSLLHYHAEESVLHGEPHKLFTDAELSMMIDPILQSADKNFDGFIDYQEFVAGPGVISY